MTAECEQIRVEQYGISLEILGYANDHITESMKCGRIYESDLLGEIYRRYGKGGVYVDFGAFVGTHTLFFAKVCDAERVISVEFHPLTCAILSENVKNNQADNVEIHNVAVDKQAGVCHAAKYGGNEGCCGISPGVSDEYTTINTVAAADFIPDDCKLVKIDVENSTIDVIEGCLPVLAKVRPIVVVEVHYDEGEKIKGMLESIGYRYYDTFGQAPTEIWEPN